MPHFMYFLLIVYVFSTNIFIPANAADIKDVSIKGVTLSASEFSDRFSGKPESRHNTRSLSTLPTSEIILSDIIISGNHLSLSAAVKVNNETIVLPINGILRASYKAQQNINSIIVEVGSTIFGYEVLLFEIFNDNADDPLFSDSDHFSSRLANMPHIKIYLENQESNLFLFEGIMPEAFSELNASNYPTANNYKDLYWAWDLVVHNTAQISTAPNSLLSLVTSASQPRVGSAHTQAFPETFYDSFYLLEDFYEIYSLPYINYSYTNVSSSDATWQVEFRIAERVEMNGIVISSGNAFTYHNVKVAFAGGANTKFIRTYQSGILRNSIGATLRNGADIIINLLKSTSTHSATFLAALECISGMSSSVTETTLGTQGIDLLGASVTAVGERFSNYYLRDSSSDGGQYIRFQAVTQSNAATVTRDTIGALVVQFDLKCSGTAAGTKAFEIPLNYTVYNY